VAVTSTVRVWPSPSSRFHSRASSGGGVRSIWASSTVLPARRPSRRSGWMANVVGPIWPTRDGRVGWGGEDLGRQDEHEAVVVGGLDQALVGPQPGALEGLAQAAVVGRRAGVDAAGLKQVAGGGGRVPKGSCRRSSLTERYSGSESVSSAWRTDCGQAFPMPAAIRSP